MCPKWLPLKMFNSSRQFMGQLGRGAGITSHPLLSLHIHTVARSNCPSHITNKQAIATRSSRLMRQQTVLRSYSSSSDEKSKATDALRRLAGHDKDRFVPTDAEVEEFKKRAAAEQRMYNALMPDLNWGITHPVTWVLFALCVGLHFYTGYRQRQIDAQTEGKRKEEAKLLNKEYVEPSSPKKGWE